MRTHMTRWYAAGTTLDQRLCAQKQVCNCITATNQSPFHQRNKNKMQRTCSPVPGIVSIGCRLMQPHCVRTRRLQQRPVQQALGASCCEMDERRLRGNYRFSIHGKILVRER
jgi:hypothetical protein